MLKDLLGKGRWRSALAMLLLLPLLLWLGVNMAHEDPPPPLWTEADLPARPDSAANGWSLLFDAQASRDLDDLGEIRPAVQQVLLSDDPDETRTLLRPTLRMRAGRRPGIKRCHLAFARPHMAYSCRPHINAQCYPLNAMTCHALTSAELLASPLSKLDDPKSTQLLNQRIAKDAELAATANTLIGQALALELLRETTEVALWLHRQRAEALDGVDLQTLRKADVEPKHAAIGEYLMSISALDSLAGDSDQGGLLYDPGASRRQLNQIFAPAQQGRYQAIAPPARGTFWWWDNAIGQQALEALAATAPAFAMIERKRKELAELRAKLP